MDRPVGPDDREAVVKIPLRPLDRALRLVGLNLGIEVKIVHPSPGKQIVHIFLTIGRPPKAKPISPEAQCAIS